MVADRRYTSRMIVRARTVVTMDGPPIDDGAVAVSEGRIVDVGKFDELKKRITEFNPIDNLKGMAQAGVKIFHIHGDKDTLVPIQQSQLIMAKFKEMGVPSKLVIKEGAFAAKEVGGADLRDPFSAENLYPGPIRQDEVTRA